MTHRRRHGGPPRGRALTCAQPARAMRLALLVALGLMLLAGAGAQADDGAGEPAVAARRVGPFRFLAAADVALALGAPLVSTAEGLTLRAETGVLTVFAGAPDALWQASEARTVREVAAVAPPLREGDAWFLPEDLLGVLGVRVLADTVLLPDGRVRPLRFPPPPPPQASAVAELIELGPAVPAMRLYATSPAGSHAVSLLAVDLGMLSLAFPEQQVSLDAHLRSLAGVKTLFLVVSSLGPSAWDPAIYVRQDGRETLLQAPFGVQVLEGDPSDVRPGAPVAAVAFLPDDIDLRRPLTLRWAGASGTLTLRR